MNEIKDIPAWRIQSDAAKAHIEKLLNQYYGTERTFPHDKPMWYREYKFDEKRKWRFDYAVPVIRCAIEIDGGTFMGKSGHNSGAGLRGWREKNNVAMSAGWYVWHYAPEEIIKAGRKTKPDEPILKELPWLKKTVRQRRLEDEI